MRNNGVSPVARSVIRTICRARSEDDAVAKIKRFAEPLSTLSKRALPVFPDDTDGQNEFMVEQTDDAEQQVIIDTGDADNINTALFSELGADPINIGLSGLCGCSGLIVMSENAVYFAHFFEDLSFDSGDEEFPADFQGLVIDFLNNGLDDQPEVQNSLAANAAAFQGQAGASAFIMTPLKEGGTGPEYADQISQLSATVAQITGLTPTVLIYDPVDCNSDELGTDARGAALYQYDPVNQATAPQKGFRFIFELSDKGIHQF